MRTKICSIRNTSRWTSWASTKYNRSPLIDQRFAKHWRPISEYDSIETNKNVTDIGTDIRRTRKVQVQIVEQISENIKGNIGNKKRDNWNKKIILNSLTSQWRIAQLKKKGEYSVCVCVMSNGTKPISQNSENTLTAFFWIK